MCLGLQIFILIVDIKSLGNLILSNQDLQTLWHSLIFKGFLHFYDSVTLLNNENSMRY